jgi:hypothetical protein
MWFTFMTDALPSPSPPAVPSGTALSSADTASLSSFAQLTKEVNSAVLRLQDESKSLQIPLLDGRGWYDLLVRKLLPQLADDAYLVVAVVGGTNIGKSVVFNHIAGFRASASSPLASGTKHPVCLVPTGFEFQHDLNALFPAFKLCPWSSSDEALKSNDEHCLFWRSNDDVPPNLVLLDTPDVDSDAPINWQRADAVRQAADVLIAVLTQQKYNDAAVKQFFRKAALEDKAALIVFNQVELPEDEPYWPLWLQTFCSETGLQPEFVYLAPNDRKAAEAIRLNFVERKWPLTLDRNGHVAIHATPRAMVAVAGDGYEGTQSSFPLRTVLSQLRFAEIKLRTLQGSLKRLVSETDGIPAYLQEIWVRSRQYQDAVDIFAARGFVQQGDWPAAPNSLIIDEMWNWWDHHREAWTASIHGFYSRIGRWVGGGVRVVRERIWGPTSSPLEEYRQAEWDAMVGVLQQVYDQLHVVTTLGNALLTSRLEQLLAGTTCESVLEKLHRDQVEFDFQALIRKLVETELAAVESQHQDIFEFLRNADRAAAVVRPGLTLLLALGGGIGAEDLLMRAGAQWVTHVAIDTTAAASTTVVGEAVIDSATSLLGQAKIWLLKLHEKFKSEREAWLVGKLKEYLLGDLLTELQLGASVPQLPCYQEVQGLVRQFEQRLANLQPAIDDRGSE